MKEEIQKLIDSLRPVQTKFDLIRVGGDNDGGYLIPNDLAGVSACFSPGVADTVSFEVNLCKRGIGSHLADASVDGAPKGFTPLSFTKKYLGGYNDNTHMTLDYWVNSKAPGPWPTGDLLLQMDIEGGEYTTILTTSRGTLNRFRIIAIEIHNVQTWFNPLAWEVVKAFFEKLLEDFHVVHNHPNNNCPFIEADGILMPTVFELTLLRKDRTIALDYCDQFPHPLDQPNVLDKPDRPLPEGWYK
jgi:hypothetical protein